MSDSASKHDRFLRTVILFKHGVTHDKWRHWARSHLGLWLSHSVSQWAFPVSRLASKYVGCGLHGWHVAILLWQRGSWTLSVVWGVVEGHWLRVLGLHRLVLEYLLQRWRSKSVLCAVLSAYYKGRWLVRLRRERQMRHLSAWELVVVSF